MPGPSALNALKQLMLPGVKTAKGTQKVPGKPGFYDIDPSRANPETRAILRRAERRALDEADLAERPNGTIPSMTGRENARGAYMLSGALNELRYASEAGGSIAEPVKGVVYVDNGGNIRAGAAIDREAARDHLADVFDLDFTKKYPNYLSYVASTVPEARGSDLVRHLQDLYGPEMVFQVASPNKNIPIYRSWGAQPMPRLPDGSDPLGGSKWLPAYQLDSRIPERKPRKINPEDYGQQRLPGFAGGGLVSLMKSIPAAYAAKKEAERATNGQPGWITNGYGDAARHAIAAGLLARRTSPDIAEKWGWFNETLYPVLARFAFSPDDPRETPMDFANEKFAREIAPAFPSDEAYIQYIMNWPDKKRPQNMPGTLQWFGKDK